MTPSNSRGAQPLLSICLPVYNGAEYLPNVLAALLPQSDELRDVVEVIVADDASQDASERICSEAAAAGRIRYIRNAPNLGMGPNIARCITEHARGRYVWIWSQHCLLRSGKLGEITQLLKKNEEICVAYVNFRCALYPDRWPDSCDGGFDGEYDYVSSEDRETSTSIKWHQLLNPHSCLCTQTYAHIVDTRRTSDFLRKQNINQSFGTAISTFTQTTATASVFFDDDVLYIGDPVFTIFNGAQTWAKPRTRGLVYFLALPELVDIFRIRGLKITALKDAEQYSSQMAAETAIELAKSHHFIVLARLMTIYYWNYWRHRESVSAMASKVLFSDWCSATRVLLAIKEVVRRCWLYLWVYWRPARAVRGIILRWQSRNLEKNQ